MTDAAGISRILTLVFPDLADSTALKTQRGDQAVGELITRHRAHVRRLAAESGGRIQPDLSLEMIQRAFGASRPEIDARRNAALRQAGLE